MPPKKRKIVDDSDDDSDPSIEDGALVSSKPDVVISLLQPDVKIVDPFQNSLFIQPNVMTMTVPALKSELNRLSVFIVGNPPKFTLQDKLLIAYADELLDKVAVHYRNFQNCSYAVLMKSKMKSVVTFRCTRYQVMAPGHPQSHWTNYKECGKILNKLNKESKKGSELFDMKTHTRSCPGKMFVHIVNGCVGLPYFPPPFHLCGNLSHIQNIYLGQQDLRPSFTLISPTINFKEVFSIDSRQSIIDTLDQKVKWSGLTGGCKKRFYVTDLASQREVFKVVEQAMKPLINHVQAFYPSLVCVRLGALKSLPQCPSQYSGHGNHLHSDYSSNFPLLLPEQRPVSVILALDPFDFIYLPHLSQKRKDLVHLTIPAGHAAIFTESCLHSGGANDSSKTLFRLFAYMVSSPDQFPDNRVFKYSWKGADDNMDATIEYSEEKGGEVGDDDEYDEGVSGDADNGGGKSESNCGM